MLTCDSLDGFVPQRLTKLEAKDAGLKLYWSDKPCSKGHTGNRRLHGKTSSMCVVCHIQEAKNYALLHQRPPGKTKKKIDNPMWILEASRRKEANNTRERLSAERALRACKKIELSDDDRRRFSTRALALEAGSVRYFTGMPCVNNHIDMRVTRSASCVSCRAAKQPQKPEGTARPRGRPRGTASPKSREERILVNRAQGKAWRDKNPSKARKKVKDRKNLVKIATPPWADFNKMNQFYYEAKSLTIETGVLHTVDHIIPLRGVDVCGLHVHNNMQVLTYFDNYSKSNKVDGTLVSLGP